MSKKTVLTFKHCWYCEPQQWGYGKNCPCECHFDPDKSLCRSCHILEKDFDTDFCWFCSWSKGVVRVGYGSRLL